MGLSVGNRLEWVRQSDIRNMSIECDKHHGINLSQGVCDLAVPPVVIKGAKEDAVLNEACRRIESLVK
jgi:aminotransferase